MSASRFPPTAAPVIVAVLGAMIVSGCSSTPANRPSGAATVQQISPRHHLDDAIASLADGHLKHARKSLKSILKDDPSNARAAMLLATLDEKPVAALGTVSFMHRVQPGETMIALSQRYLGNPLKFYLLSRYNGIDVPSSVRAGQTLRIPGVAPKPVLAAPRPAKAETLRADAAPNAAAPAIDRNRVNQLRAGGLNALNRGQINRAVVLLGQAAKLDPGNLVVRRDLDRAVRLRATVKGGK